LKLEYIKTNTKKLKYTNYLLFIKKNFQVTLEKKKIYIRVINKKIFSKNYHLNEAKIKKKWRV
jgi:hypothetical protein